MSKQKKGIAENRFGLSFGGRDYSLSVGTLAVISLVALLMVGAINTEAIDKFVNERLGVDATPSNTTPGSLVGQTGGGSGTGNAGMAQPTPTGQANYASSSVVRGNVYQYEDSAALASEIVYASTEEPLSLLYSYIEPKGVKRDTADSDGVYELTLSPGNWYFWTWPTTRYPEVKSMYVQPQERSTDKQLGPDFDLRQISNISTPMNDEISGTVYYWNWSATSLRGKWDLAGNGTAASASQAYRLSDRTDEYFQIKPEGTNKYLKDMKVEVVTVPSAAQSKLKEFSISVLNTNLLEEVTVQNVKVTNNAEADYLLLNGYISQEIPAQIDFYLETEAGASISDAEDLMTIGIDDMRGMDFSGTYSNDYNTEAQVNVVG